LNEITLPREIIIGNRIPKDYFITRGVGQSDLTVHAGSYHLALKEAGIEMCNIMTYSSILPSIATEVERPKTLIHGSVMESIVSVCTVNKGERATAGIIYGWLRYKDAQKFESPKLKEMKHGGLVCEIFGDYSEGEIRNLLSLSLDELYFNGYSEDYILENPTFIIESFVPEKKFGTALAAICFVNYLVPTMT
jgi:arginine decarboxylase